MHNCCRSLICVGLLISSIVISINTHAYELQVPRQPASACFTDLNADGFQDIILGHKTGWGYTNPTISILMNDGFGQFGVVDTTLSFCGYQENLILHDIDNDGNQDLIALTGYVPTGTSDFIQYFRVFSNFSQTNHSYNDYPLGRNNTVYKVICVDLPNAEHVICWISNQGLYWGYFVFNNNGIPSPPVFYDLDTAPQDITCSDINQDGVNEIILKEINSISIWSRNTTGFTETILADALRGFFCFIQDINNDYNFEVVNFNNGFSSTIIKVLSYPGMAETYSLGVPVNVFNPKLMDVNNDSYSDIVYNTVITNPFHADDHTHTWINYITENGILQPVILNTGSSSYNSYPIDVDNDGFIDIVTLNIEGNYSGHIHILYNDGNGNYVQTSPTPNEDDNLVHPSVELSCYPNPFREQTTINITAKAPLFYPQIEIYNVKGQRIKSLELQKSCSQVNTITWDGTDDNHRRVSSGIYFLKIVSENVEWRLTKCIKY
jgi:hypothetical protein